MASHELKNFSSERKFLHLAKISQIGGNPDTARSHYDSKLPSTSRSYGSKRELTLFSANSRDTTLETHQQQEIDEYSMKALNKQVKTILEGELDDQNSVRSCNQTVPKKLIAKKKSQQRQLESKRQANAPGIVNYLGYLNESDEYESQAFRQRLKEKSKIEQTNNLSTLQLDETYLGSRLTEAIKQQQQQREGDFDLGELRITRKRDASRGMSIARLSSIPRLPDMLQKKSSLSRDTSLNGLKIEFVDRDELKGTLQILAKEFELFTTCSQRERNIFERIRDYILDKPELMKIFYHKKIQRFKDPITSSELYKILILEAEIMSARGVNPISRVDSTNISPLRRKKTQILPSFVRIPQRLNDQIRFFIAELKDVNLHYQLGEISDLGNKVSDKEREIQNKSFRLARKLYFADKARHDKFRDVIDSLEKDRPYLRMRIEDKLTDFEKRSGELPLVNPKFRDIGKAWDNLIMKWENTRQNIVVTDKS